MHTPQVVVFFGSSNFRVKALSEIQGAVWSVRRMVMVGARTERMNILTNPGGSHHDMAPISVPTPGPSIFLLH